MGRLLESKQETDGQTYTSGYQYDLAGAVTQETYPSGKIVNTEYDADGELSRITGRANTTATPHPYATGFSFFPDGKIERLKLGNNLWESAKLNSRLQVTELALGYSENDGSLFKLNYDYGELQTNGTVDASKNAGNIAKQTVTFHGLANPFIQTYRYDALDRITEAVEKVNGTQTWKQTFGYDVYGNRTSFYQIIGSQELTINNLTLPTIDTATNRFAGSQGYTYDKNGNITADPANNGRTFVFNGDNKQTEVKNASNVTIGTYFYDGNGKRVKKVTDLETTVFVYDGLGKLTAEYSTATPPEVPKINYTATDQIGSPRVITDTFGIVQSRRDFMPFGEELYADGTYRKTSDDYGNTGQDAVRQRFTGYQRDLETNLDFAEARYYNNAHGRFTAIDPLLASGKSANPQTFNRYLYVLNNPLTSADPSGMDPGIYFDHSGNYLGWDGKYDNNVYFATVTRQTETSTYIDVNSIASTTLDAVQRAAVSAVPLTLGTDNQQIQTLTATTANSAMAGTTGVPKGIVNFGIDTINSFSNPLGPIGATAGVPNPLAIPRLTGSTPLEQDYMDASELGTATGTIVAGAAVAPSSSVSVVPKESPSGITELVKSAQELFPAKAGRFEEHHIEPKYLGGSPSGPTSRIDAAYHQVITNEFRTLHPYGQGAVSRTRMLEIMKAVYSRFPLP